MCIAAERGHANAIRVLVELGAYKTVRTWGSLDSEEIHRMLTEKGYEFEVSEKSVLIKNQESNLVEVKTNLENQVTQTNCVFCCELKDNGDIEVTRKHIA